MRLYRQGREFYTLVITTTPPLGGGWEASFDAGATWTAGAAAGDGWRWLVRGPACPDDPAYPSTPIPRTLYPLVRAVDHPELVVRGAPLIALI